MELKLKSFTGAQDRSMMTPVRASHLGSQATFAFTALEGFNTRKLAPYLDSMARVSRRVVLQHFVSESQTGHFSQVLAEATIQVYFLPSPTIGNEAAQTCVLSRERKTTPPTLSHNPFRHSISGNFHMLLSILFIFPSQYLFAIGLVDIFRFTRITPRTLSSNPKLLDSCCSCVRITLWSTRLSRSTALDPSRLFHNAHLQLPLQWLLVKPFHVI